MLTSSDKVVAIVDWQNLTEQHRVEVRKWTVPYRARRGAHKTHPVFDFLFTYYPFSLGKLEQWHPGMGRILENEASLVQSYNPRHYHITET